MSTIKTITQMNKVDVEQIIRQMPKRLRAYVSDNIKTNMPERIIEFALSYMLEDLAEQAEAKQKADEELPEMSESDDDD